MKKTLSRKDCVLVYDTYGDPERPAVVLLHGYGVDAKMWAPQLEALGDAYGIVPDIRAHGRSRPCGNFTVAEAAEDLHAILEAEHCRRFVLIGLSMGGLIAQEFARRYGGASGYFILGAVPIFLDCYSSLEKVLLKHSAGMMNLYPWKTLKREMVKVSAATETARAQIAPLFDNMTKQEFIASWKGLSDCIHREEVRFDAPLWVACGELDNTGTVRKCLKEWGRAYPNCRTFEFSNASHVANLDAPKAFNTELRAFLSVCF
ncbi:MAG TPA: alpha/beta hydrolase [Candidatus Limiplasma sp.]|nr:alpha/beta hydrolase [Candidatus Limiplasma sp.]HPS80841.1 alpha/beta hydrolase [Candidatus Limiplasma sp.]